MYKVFLQDLEKESSDKINKLRSIQENLNSEMLNTALFFSEDPKSFKFNEFIKNIKEFITSFKKSSLKWSNEEVENIKKQINREKKSKPNKENKIISDLQKMTNSFVKKASVEDKELKNMKKNKESLIHKQEIPTNVIKFAEKENINAQNNDRFGQERITNFITFEENFNDIDKNSNHVNHVPHNTTKSLPKSTSTN
jgi:hypothetical protein